MGVAALVLGIVSLVISFIPLCGTWALIPAIVGVVLGIVDWVKKKKEDAPKGKAIAGTICSGIAIIVIVAWWLLFGIAANEASKELNRVIETTDWNETFSGWNITIDE